MPAIRLLAARGCVVYENEKDVYVLCVRWRCMKIGDLYGASLLQMLNDPLFFLCSRRP